MNILGISASITTRRRRCCATASSWPPPTRSASRASATIPTCRSRRSTYCLEAAGIEIDDLDYVVFYDKPFIKFERILMTYIATFPRSLPSFAKAMPVWLKEKLWVPRADRRRARLRGRGALRRAPPVARRLGVPALAVRGSGDPDLRRRRRMGDDHPGHRTRQPFELIKRDPLPALARAALQRLHLLPRASR